MLTRMFAPAGGLSPTPRCPAAGSHDARIAVDSARPASRRAWRGATVSWPVGAVGLGSASCWRSSSPGTRWRVRLLPVLMAITSSPRAFARPPAARRRVLTAVALIVFANLGTAVWLDYAPLVYAFLRRKVC